MRRRAFLQRIGAAVVGATLARVLPGIAPKPQLTFHPDAFELLMPPETFPTRFDCLYGFAAMRPVIVVGGE